jgi:type IV pilus assembly protein PilE
VIYRGIRSVHADRGFTLVELLIAIVIIGLLASMAITQTSGFKDRSFATTMRSDLRNFATYEESFFYDNAVYSSDLGLVMDQGYRPSPSVTVTIAEATATGWAVVASHGQSTVECGLFVGDAAAVGAATDEGVTECQ